MRGNHTFKSINKEIFSLARTLVVGDLSAPRRVEDLPVRLQMFDSEDILRFGMDRLAEKVMYFNDHYVYRTGIGTRMPDSESNEIDVDTAEYANVLDDRFDIFVNPNTDSLLIPIDGDEDWLLGEGDDLMLSSTLLWIVSIPGSGIYVFALITVSIENRIAQISLRRGVEFDFDILLFFSRKQ